MEGTNVEGTNMERIELEGNQSIVIDESDRTVKKLRPFRGLFWGLVFGIGLAGVLIVTTTITVSVLGIVAVLVVGLFVGVVWGVLGPAKKPKGPPPSTRVIVTQVPTSRFDDFGTPAPTGAAPLGAPAADRSDEPAPSDDAATNDDADTSTGWPAPGDGPPSEEQRPS